MVEYVDYRLAFIIPHSRQLLGVSTNGDLELPLVRIPMWQRPADLLTRTIEEKWNIKSVVLDILPTSAQLAPCAVIEVRHSSWKFEGEGFRAVTPDTICNASLTDEERNSLACILSGFAAALSPFSRLGWIDEAKEWIRSSIKDRTITFTDEIKQLNAGGAFCLIRLSTVEGPSYWLKAVGEPNTREFGITMYLAKNYPDYLPRIVAEKRDWNAWVMEDFGRSLDISASLKDFESAVHKLASLQKQLTCRCQELLAVRCGDHRTQTLRGHIDPLIAYLDEAMHLQTSTRVVKLSGTRLREIGNLLHRACCSLEELGIPDSIMHNDVSPGSILISEGNCVFTDWCEAFVGNPFITLEQICVHATNNTHEADAWKKKLREVYRVCWKDLLTESQISRALEIVPIISVLCCLFGRGDWLSSPKRDEPGILSYSRSLARHMDRIAQGPDFVEALCQRG